MISNRHPRHNHYTPTKPNVVSNDDWLHIGITLHSYWNIHLTKLMINGIKDTFRSHQDIISDIDLSVQFAVYTNPRIIADAHLRSECRTTFNIQTLSRIYANTMCEKCSQILCWGTVCTLRE